MLLHFTRVVWRTTLFILILLQCIKFTWTASPGCRVPRLRKEIRDLTEIEWTAFVNALNQLKRSGRYDIYTQIHIDHTQTAHGGVQFLPWHRRFLYQFETEVLEITGNALTGLPFFDPFLSYDIFTPNSPRYVGNGQGCVVDGPFAGWRAIDNRCLTRQLTGTPATIDPRVLFVLAGPTFVFPQFANTYEYGQHADVHGAVGGHMTTLNGAPNDPMFWLHHGHVDYVWYKRQWFDVERLYWEFAGQHLPTGVTTVNLNTRIPPWNDNIAAISDTYSTLCYDYLDPAAPFLFPRSLNATYGQRPPTTPQRGNARRGPLTHFSVPSQTMMRNMRMDPVRATHTTEFMNQIVDHLNVQLESGIEVPAFSSMHRDTRVPNVRDAGEGVRLEFNHGGGGAPPAGSAGARRGVGRVVGWVGVWVVAFVVV